MKKMLLTLVCAATALGVCAAPQEVGFDKLPKPAREFIEKNFSIETVKSVEMDRKSTWDRYTVLFDNGSTIAFEGDKGTWTEILMKSGSVPATAVPPKIQTYIAKEYPGETITQITRSQKGYVVGLSDGETIPFDQNGEPAKMKHGH